MDSSCVELSMFSFCNWPLITVFPACVFFFLGGSNNSKCIGDYVLDFVFVSVLEREHQDHVALGIETDQKWSFQKG